MSKGKVAAGLRKGVAALTAAAIVCADIGHVIAATPPSVGSDGIITRADYEACQSRDEAGFRGAIEQLTAKSLAKGLATVDYKAVVGNEWRRSNLDEIIDKRVDTAMNEVKDETSWSNLLSSLAYKEKAAELATAVAERVYKSDQLKTALETLAGGIGVEIGRAIELGTIDAGEPALECMKAFLGPRYGRTIAGVVASDAGREFAIEPGKGSAGVSTGAVLAEGREGIAGAVILLVRRQLQNMASRIGQRIVGALLGRLVAVVAGGIGVVLIAKDIWDFRYGVLPIIATEMKSAETKEKVRAELTKTIQEQIGEHAKDIAGKTADRVVDIWQEFRRAHAKVLDLADRNEAFRAFLDVQKPENLGRVDEVVALVLASEGEAGVLKRLIDGTLQQATATMPPAAIDIMRETRSLETALKWTALAGNALPKVAEYELHKRTSPDAFSAVSLSRLFGIGDRLAITRLAAIKRSARDVLFDLDDGELKQLGRGIAEGDLETLAGYLTGLERSASQRVLRAVAANPVKMVALGSERVRNAILTSRDQSAAVSMMLRNSATLDPGSIAEDFDLAFKGRINPLLIWEKHPEAVGVLGLGGVTLLLLLRRLLFGSRRNRRRPRYCRTWRTLTMLLVTTETIGDTPVRHGALVFASAVAGANIVRDVREAITNYVGGNMTRYEYILDKTIERCFEQLSAKAKAAGYDGVLAIRVSHPMITTGALEVVAVGTGFNYVNPPAGG